MQEIFIDAIDPKKEYPYESAFLLENRKYCFSFGPHFESDEEVYHCQNEDYVLTGKELMDIIRKYKRERG